ncbi:helix-turn-helix domain-containing protein [Enterococcus faecalis]
MKEFRQAHSHGDYLFPFEVFNQAYTMANIQTVYMHWHQEIEWIFCEEGSISVFVNGKKYIVEKGQMLTIPEKAIHYIITNSECHYYTCVFQKKLLKMDVLDGITYQYICPYINEELEIEAVIPDSTHVIESLFKKIYTVEHNRGLTYQLKIRLLLLELFSYLIENQHLKKNDNFLNTDVQIQKIYAYIEQNYKKKITNQQLSALVNYNPEYFSRYFKKQSGYSPTDFINYYRIERACDLLFHTKLSILEIGIECGFENCSYFIKKFKSIKGQSPKKYRKLILDNHLLMSKW